MFFKEIKERVYQLEKQTLSPQATFSFKTRGRKKIEDDEETDFRTPFQKDRDRIIHSYAFRKLKDKSQVFVSIFSSSFRTRLTHSLEVAQISRTIARAVGLNEMLTEAISLGHDLGHTPFGHVGERFLDKKLPGGFKHSVHSLRVVDVLEKEGEGLNLTYEVRDGILKHSKPPKNIMASIKKNFGEHQSIEGLLVKVCDSVAYINHDIDDALKTDLLRLEDLPKESLEVLGYRHSERINTMVRDLIYNFSQTGKIGMSEEVLKATNILRDFLYENLYNIVDNTEEIYQVEEILETIYEFYYQNPEKIEESFFQLSQKLGSGVERMVADYIASLTDTSVIREYIKVLKLQGKTPTKSFEIRLRDWIERKFPGGGIEK